MFELTGRPLQVMAFALAVLLPVLAVVLWSRRRRDHSGIVWRIAAVLGRVGIIVLAQVSAMFALFLYVNNDNGFYTSWDDLLGIQDNGPVRFSPTSVRAGTGTVDVLDVTTSSGVVDNVLVWLPPGYDPAVKLPVVMFLPGQPGSVVNTFNNYGFGPVASQAISSHAVKPFIAVFPPIMISPPRDTECVDVPGGPQAETWISTTVPEAVEAKYNVAPMGKNWSMVGWSTGALCAAKIMLRYPDKFSATVALAGVYEPYLDDTTGDLFGDQENLRNENSSRWLYERYGMRGTKLLMISGKQDLWSWRDTERFAALTKGNPDVSLLSFPHGGHNFQNYASYLSDGLEWLNTEKAFG